MLPDAKPQSSSLAPRTLHSHWRVIACDLDGTLIGWDKTINDRDLEALRRARAAGIHLAICTGRNSLECANIIEKLNLTGPGVFVNGAMVGDMATGRTIDARCISYDLAMEAVDFFGSLGHAVLVLTDDHTSGMPAYFLTDHAPPHASTTDWLRVHGMQAAVCSDIPADHRDRIVRLGIIAEVEEGLAINAALLERFDSRAASHSIHSPFYDCQIIEIFCAGTDKWSGIELLARSLNVSADQVIAIGDDSNDIAMLQGARLSFAMGNAKREILAAAKRVTAAHVDCGVAQVIDELLAGRLEP